MALAFADLRTEFFARGFDYLNDGAGGLVRAKRFINDAMHAIDDLEPWPYLTASTTNAAPFAIADLDRIEAVIDVANLKPLVRASRGEIANTYAALTTPGPPALYYVTDVGTINVYPTAASTSLTVTYWKFGPDLVADADAPLMPDRFRYAIVEYAVATALRDDESQDALVAQQAGDVIVDRMRSWAGLLNPLVNYITPVGDDC